MAPRLAPTTSILMGAVQLPTMSRHWVTKPGSGQPVRNQATAISVLTSGTEIMLRTLRPFSPPLSRAVPML